MIARIRYCKYWSVKDGQPCSDNCGEHKTRPCGRVEAEGYVELDLNEVEEKRVKLRLKLWKIK